MQSRHGRARNAPGLSATLENGGVGFVKGCSDAWYTNALPGTAQGGEPVYDRSSGIAASAMSAHAIGNRPQTRSEEHTSELQSLMRISYAVFCLKKKTR